MRDYFLVAIAALVAFGATLGGSFHFDDYSLFTNPAVVSPGGWLELFRVDQTRPLSFLTFWLNYQAGGTDATGYHVFNLTAHIAAALLLLRVARRLFSHRAALIAATLFAVHPLATEPAAYVFARPALLMTVFCLLSLDAWLRDRRWLAVAWFIAALLAKEECAAFPLLLGLLHFSAPRGRREWLPIATMIVLAIAAGVRVIYALSITPAAWAGPQAGVSPAAYLAIQGPVILRYLRQLVIPWGFSVDPQIGPFAAWVEIAAWVAIATAVVIAARRFSVSQPGFWFIAGLILLLPSSSIFPASDVAADRRMYLPMVAFMMATGLLLEHIDWRVWAVAAVAFCAISIRYSLVWQTEESLWTEAVHCAPMKVRPRIHLARALAPADALRLLDETEKLAPRDPDVASEQGRIYLAAGMAPQALTAFGRALALRPGDPNAIQNRGAALLALGQADAARQDFERALRQDPCLFEARLNLMRMRLATPPVPSNCRYTSEQMAQRSRD